MKKLNKKEQAQYDALSAAEKKIYDSVMSSFPASAHESALDIAWQGGVKWNFIPT